MLELASTLLVRPARSRLPVIERASLSPRDRSILEAMLDKLGGSARDFEDAARALHEAVEERIPGGRTYVLGATPDSPIFGSIISGVGIAAGTTGVILVRIDRAGCRTVLGDLRR